MYDLDLLEICIWCMLNYTLIFNLYFGYTVYNICIIFNLKIERLE